MRIVPAPDRRVRDPETRRIIGPEGLTIDPANLHWAHLLAWKDIVEAPEPEPEPEAPAADQQLTAPEAPIEEPQA